MALEQPVFYYDLGSPESYLIAEQVAAELSIVPEFEPVLARALDAVSTEPDRAEIERRAQELDLQPMRWPVVWPPETERAMLTATFAKRGGKAVAFTLAAFRQAFAGGRDLGDEDTVLLAAAACEMHPTAVLKGITLRSVRSALAAAGERARAAGVTTLPSVQVSGQLFTGPDCLTAAEAALVREADHGAPA